MVEPPSESPQEGLYQFRVRLPVAWRAELRAAARRNGVTQADVIRMAIRHFLSGRFQS